MNFTDCTRCESTVRESDASDGMCEACFSLNGPQDYVEMVEVPKPVLEKLAGMAKTRHPTACNKEAPMFQRVMEEEGLL